MGVKTARTKRARQELRKVHKAIEVCQYCRKKVANVEEHIEAHHSFICERCGHRFSNQVHWRQHMKDKHGLDQKAAEKDGARKQLEKWVKGKKGSRAAARRKAAAAGAGEANVADVATQVLANDDDESMDDEEESQTRMYTNKCDLCGAEAQLPINLSGGGMGFTCAYLGRPCRSSSSTAPAIGQTQGSTAATAPSLTQPPQTPLSASALAPAPVPAPAQQWIPFQAEFQTAAHCAQFTAAMQAPLPDDDDDDL